MCCSFEGLGGQMGFSRGAEKLLSPFTHPAQEHWFSSCGWAGGWAHQHMACLVMSSAALRSVCVFVRGGGGSALSQIDSMCMLGVGVEALCG